MDKSIVRVELIERLEKLSEVEKGKIEKRLVEKLLAHSWWENASTIGLTLAQALEIDTKPLIKAAWQSDKKVVVPRTKKAGQMDFVYYTPETKMERSSFGILEPIKSLPAVPKEQIQLLIVPGVGFNSAGYRIGFGAGYYDRYLADYQGKTISLALPQQLTNDWTVDSYDIPVQLILT
ncbi:5-formyltetrahydrofolate cyclo-ligase [Carnobacterium maltaromaticum]|uniref:5-formyltetrahydrofolate cyclo-ligase n=1 Tax=Carnobacterium maltaromaticum TaxID=2751 RepID=A0AAW9K3C9_CARML|nr:5-formyltetrahydrofolate cyclo-ligase [Carnobacterium maltaromaticum]MBC9788434.1 5-formyltetrahydrofolate cyclo-ligase [Carnobacterium maltaromaticum]MDZ5758262.1 5-formyltetrahydrofolate cyclo-ligase [Carnobacterium maltaromaticum]